jgi:Flp pilus assembly protein TadD
LRHPIPAKVAGILRKALDSRDPAIEKERLLRALEEPAAKPYALKRLGVLHLNQKQLADALKDLTEAARQLPWDAEAHALLGYALYAASDVSGAESEIQRALAIDQNQPVAHLGMALIVFERSRVMAKEALAHLRKAGSALPAARMILAGLYAQAGLRAEAEREYRALRELPEGAASPEERESAERWLAAHQFIPK